MADLIYSSSIRTNSSDSKHIFSSSSSSASSSPPGSRKARDSDSDDDVLDINAEINVLEKINFAKKIQSMTECVKIIMHQGTRNEKSSPKKIVACRDLLFLEGFEKALEYVEKYTDTIMFPKLVAVLVDKIR